MSVATASAVLRLRLTSTISRALPRLTAAMAQAQPTLPVPIMPIFTGFSMLALSRRRCSGRSRHVHGRSWFYAQKRRKNRLLLCNAGCLEQEPDAPLGLVDPILYQAGGCHVVVLVANRVRLAQARDQLLVVVAQLGEHVQRRDEIGVIVQHALQAADVANRAQRSAADLAHALGDVVGSRENLLGLLVEEEVIVAEMGPRYMPMEVLGLQVKREHVSEQDVERAGNFRHGVGAQVGGRVEPGEAQRG